MCIRDRGLDQANLKLYQRMNGAIETMNNQPESLAQTWRSEMDIRFKAQGDTLIEQIHQSKIYAEIMRNETTSTLRMEMDIRFKDLGDKLVSQTQRAHERIEFIREEILFELRKGLRTKPSDHEINPTKNNIESRIIRPEKIDRSPLVLNLGCGHLSKPDMVNVDARELPGVDILADVSDIPLEPDSVNKIFAAHLLEHFPQRYLVDILLPHWKKLLKPGGVLNLVVPDSEAMLEAYSTGEMSFDDFALVTFGKQDYEGDFHYAMYTPMHLKQLLEKSGFTDITITHTNRINGMCREMECIAHKELH